MRLHLRSFWPVVLRICFAVLLILDGYTGSLHAQSAMDALRYGNIRVLGTSRHMASGGAMGALGADFSVIATNPAGIAAFRRSDFSLAPSLQFRTTDSRLTNDPTGPVNRQDRTVFALESAGAVFATKPRNFRWPNINFGLGVVRLADFNQRFFFDGVSRGSIVDRFQDQANAGIFSDFESNLAIDAEALFQLQGDNFYFSDFGDAPNALVGKTQQVTQRGSINEIEFNIAANYDEKLFFGATIGLPILQYEYEKIYREFNDFGEVPNFEFLEFTEGLETNGVGVNLKLGLIYRVVQAVRLGFAFHTPTRYRLEDRFLNDFIYEFTLDDEFISNLALSPEGLFEYTLSTPWRIIGSAGFLIGRFGFLSAELEYLDFTNSRFRFNGFPQDEALANETVNMELDKALIMRFGGEVALGKLRLRGGLGILPTGMASDSGTDISWSAGLGYRAKSFYVEAGYRQFDADAQYRPYLVSRDTEPLVNNQVGTSNASLTLGFRF